MNFESINLRMERINHSIKIVKVKDFVDNCSTSEDADGTIHFNFGSTNEQENETIIISVISNLGALKDNLKNRVSFLGLDKKLVEDEINKFLVLKLVTDLDNQYKHGIPLNRTRYDKGPIDVINIRVAVRIYNRPATTFKESKPQKFSMGEVTTIAGDNTETVIDAEIVDRDGNLICYLDDLIDDSFRIWQKFIEVHKLHQ